MLVVRPLELKQSQAELFDRLEAPYPQDIFLQRANEALRDTVAFGLPHEARRAFDAEERDLVWCEKAAEARSVLVESPK